MGAVQDYQCDFVASGCLQPSLAAGLLQECSYVLHKNGKILKLKLYVCTNSPCLTAMINAVKAAYQAMP